MIDYLSSFSTSAAAYAPAMRPGQHGLHALPWDVPTLHVDATCTDDDLAKDLLELFPADDSSMIVDSPSVSVDEPTLAWRGAVVEAVSSSLPSTVAPTTKPKRRRRRNRKRTDQQKLSENIKRQAKQIQFYAARKDCLAQERYVRGQLRACIHAFAEAIGLTVVDASILPLLPVELRTMMARSDEAMETYLGFSGQTALREELNAMPKWW